MLQILDEGRLTDSQGIVVDFKNTIIVLTSNLGAEILINQREEDDQHKIKEQVMEYVRAVFKPEFLNRLDEIILFHKLTHANIHDIVKIQLDNLKKILLQQNIILQFDESAINYLADKGYDSMFGARPLKRVIQRELQNHFAKMILSSSIMSGDTVNIKSTGSELVINKVA